MMLRTRLREIFLPHIGWLTFLSALGLVIVGVLAIRTTPHALKANKQLMWTGIGVLAMFLTALPHHRRIGQFSYPLMGITLIMLIALLLPLPRSIVPVLNGSRRWFDLKVTMFQPSEVAKVVYVMSLAYYLRYRENYRTVKGLLIPLGLTFIPLGLILKEPDLGTSMTFLPVFFAMLIAAGAKLKHLVVIVVLGVSIVPVMYPLLKPHQKARVKAMVAQVTGDKTYRSDIGYQGYKAMTLVGAGGLEGHTGRHAGNLVKFNALPEPHNDMIFAAICVRKGVCGGMVVLLLYLVFIVTGLIAAGLNKDPYARLVAVGIVTIVFFQMFVNVGMTIGILPITGMTLPFVSYGGSSLVVNFAMVGLIFNVASRRPMILARPSFEFDRPAQPAC